MTNVALVEDSETVSTMTPQEAFKAILAGVNKQELEKMSKQLYLSLAAAIHAYAALKAVMLPMDRTLLSRICEENDDFDYNHAEWLRFLSESYHTPSLDRDQVEKFMKFASLAGLSISKITGIK